ncbi:quinolinate synthase [Aequitasia blattaphilus]|uniref:Quinolinate synthase n=1 Tax=Aequitasia blattaphilus TaxID=2949332 RepID=A0ABT1E7G8_9FIRM|nr:quinolinate synthase NadA [Aequitasia blattaphilus]MCP1100922.1 quinolinate synthase NadA [Aequitasia blattaphilus]MCR8613562.1 quinolinate synthase NadA [Aequitasia blattaphilus]
MKKLVKEIESLKKEKDAVILAHYYVPDEIQEIADYIGDSYYLSELATKVPQNTIVFCGVSFMGESAKILNPQKTVLLPEPTADCPMAHMAEAEHIRKLREETEDLAVVCYINSSAKLKAVSDVCVTSSNALKIVAALPNKNILFIPDEHLGRYIASLLPEKNFIFNPGYCHVHASIQKENLIQLMWEKKAAKVLVHPECPMEIIELGDYVGSTSGIIEYATNSNAKEFILCTETGVTHELLRRNPNKIFHSVEVKQICPDMKKITLEKVHHTLKTGENEVLIHEDLRQQTYKPLERMLELAK